MRTRGAGLVIGFVALVAATLGCNATSDDQVLPPDVVGLTPDLAPTYDDGEMQIYEVHKRATMPIRRPEDGERPQGDVQPYPRAPFQLANDTSITVRYTITNLDDQPHTVELLVDPWNEFVRYVPGVVVGDEETTPNFSGIDRFFPIAGKQRVEGILTPDDMVELATDLATAMQLDKTPPGQENLQGPALFNRAFNVQNRSSEHDPVLAPFIPKVIAGLIGFDMGLRTYEKAKIALEMVIDVEDLEGDRVVKPGDDSGKTYNGPPGNELTPPPPPATDG